MCCEFVHACESLLIDEIAKAIDTDKYFLLCFEHLNYFHCDDLISIKKVNDLLGSKGVVLHEIEDADLLSLIDVPYMRDNHIFHGNSVLFNQFREKCEI